MGQEWQHTLLIPVLVTGIQPPRVRAARESFQAKDLGWKDSCDKHRNEGGEGDSVQPANPKVRIDNTRVLRKIA
ncbi:hypothetical protein GGE29_003478 [Agrobacterium tumefaciens]|nr:hypothetical protein [Agrobacterium radiobacter]MBB4453197.1 hypothetical protein [Agrobacterium radiobacter]